MKRVAWLAFLIAACDEPAPPPPHVEPSVEPRPEPDPAPTPDPAPDPAPPATPSTGGACQIAAPLLAGEHAGSIAIAAGGASFVAAIEGDGGQSLRLVRVDDGVEVLSEASLENGLARRGGPAIAVRDASAAVAIVLPDRHVSFAVVDLAQPRIEWHSIAEGASPRFDLAIAPAGPKWAVAWTDERATPMRVRARLVDAAGAGDPAADLTPAGAGAAAPRFMSHGSGSELVFIDPRAAISVVHHSALGASGLAAAEVLRPVGNAAEPPEVACARAGADTWVGYTAVGTAAMTAVGLVRAGDQASPTPIVPGRGYGELHVDAVAAGRSAIFVADSPTASPAGSAREVHVRVLRDGALTDPTLVRGPGGDGSRGRIARDANGRIAVAFLSGGSAYVALGRCAE